MSRSAGGGLFWTVLLGGGAVGVASLLTRNASASARPSSTPTRPAAPAPLFIDDEVEALARVIASEIGRGSREQKTHVAWATRNLATERKMSIAKMACQPCGKQGADRPVSTARRGSLEDREIAALVLASPNVDDPTGGASHFINPPLQDRLAAKGQRPGYVGRSYAVVRKRWIEVYGWEPYYRLGEELELWGPRRAA